MTRAECELLIAAIAAAFPKMQLASETVAVFTSSLIDLEADLAREATYAVMKRATFFPTIGEIRHEYAALKLQAPGEADAYGQALSPPPRHRLVQRARELVGDDWTWRTEPAHLTRRDFTAMYRSLLDDATRQIVQASPERPELASVVREISP